ncbi:hypothetical protein BH11PSE11_BH11PSE11_00580 [soil metagenome]
MSGPTTAFIITDPIAALLAAAETRAAQQRRNQAHRAPIPTARVAVKMDQHENTKQSGTAEAEFDQLTKFAGRLRLAQQVRATRARFPNADYGDAVTSNISMLRNMTENLRTILLTEAARRTPQDRRL